MSLLDQTTFAARTVLQLACDAKCDSTEIFGQILAKARSLPPEKKWGREPLKWIPLSSNLAGLAAILEQFEDLGLRDSWLEDAQEICGDVKFEAGIQMIRAYVARRAAMNVLAEMNRLVPGG